MSQVFADQSGYAVVQLVSRKPSTFAQARSAVHDAVLAAGQQRLTNTLARFASVAHVSVDARYGHWVPARVSPSAAPSPPVGSVLAPLANLPAAQGVVPTGSPNRRDRLSRCPPGGAGGWGAAGRRLRPLPGDRDGEPVGGAGGPPHRGGPRTGRARAAHRGDGGRCWPAPTAAFLRTGRHPAAAGLGQVETFDAYYDAAPRPSRRSTSGSSRTLVAAATEVAPGGRVVYAVPGSPLVAERTVELLRADPRVEVTVVPALSFLDLAWARLGVDPVAAGVRLVDGTRFADRGGRRARPAAGGPVLVAPGALATIKLSVDTDRPGPAPATVLHHLGLPDEQVSTVPWDELDRFGEPDHLTSIWVPALAAPVAAELVALDELVRTLRAALPLGPRADPRVADPPPARGVLRGASTPSRR